MSIVGSWAEWGHLMPLEFRNVDASPHDPVLTWPYEALVTAIDRGLVRDWQPIFTEIRRSPWGSVVRRIEHYLRYREHDGVSELFSLVIERAREDVDLAATAEVALRIGEAVARSGLSKAEFASHVGTSASRLSTYLSGKVSPSAAMFIRMETAATPGPGF